ncbi:hypothetical protein ACIQF5_29225 [Streptomyces goshikiensis]|uniref:hypothetical protein n=1 Tax=Streptomyces goshikiensis TaxID=1942 RepID=UPI00381B9999
MTDQMPYIEHRGQVCDDHPVGSADVRKKVSLEAAHRISTPFMSSGPCGCD